MNISLSWSTKKGIAIIAFSAMLFAVLLAGVSTASADPVDVTLTQEAAGVVGEEISLTATLAAPAGEEGATLALSSESGSFTDCNSSPITELTFGAGESEKEFCYSNTVADTYTVVVGTASTQVIIEEEEEETPVEDESITNTQTGAKYAATELELAINQASEGNTLSIKGTIGAPDEYTAYEITKPLTLQGEGNPAIYGSFIIKTDGVTVDGLTIYTRGGGNGPLKNAIDVIAKNATITNNVFELPNPEALADGGGVGNGVTVWPYGDGEVDYNISGNAFVGYQADTDDWSSSALQIVEGLSLSRFGMAGTSVAVDLDPEVEKDLALGNDYTDSTNNYVHSNWSSGVAYKYVLASTEDQMSSLEYMVDGSILLLDGNITLTKQFTIDRPITIEGNDATLNASFEKTDNDNNSAIGVIGTEDVTIKDLTLDGAGGSDYPLQLHGLHAYESTGVELDGVTIVNFKGAAAIINGSTVTATDLHTEGNLWGAINVDPGSGVATSSAFTLNNGTLTEDTQIWSDGAHVNETANVIVNANGYTKYSVGSNAFTWSNKGIAHAATIGTTVYSSIQAAIDAAVAGDTIEVGAGTYEGFSVVGKTGLTIKGIDSEQTIIAPTEPVSTGEAHKYTSNMKASVFVDASTDITLENMSIRSTDATPGSTNGTDAIVFWNASTGTIQDCAIMGTYEVNGVQTGQGIAVDASGAESVDLTVEASDISGFQKNAIDAINGNGASIGSTGTVTITIVDGSLTGMGPTDDIAQNGLVVWNRGGGTVTASVEGTTISGFNYTPEGDYASGALAYGGGALTSVRGVTFTDNELNLVTAEGSPQIDATQNWWGTTSSTTIASFLSGDVAYDPWYLNSSRNALSNTVSDDGSVTPTNGDAFTVDSDTEGEVTMPDGVDTIVLSNTTALDLSKGIEEDHGDKSVTLNSGTADDVTIKNADNATAEVTIQNGTTITTDDEWDGTFLAPQQGSSAGTAPAGFQIGDTVIEVGAPGHKLTLSTPATVFLAGATGPVGYKAGDSDIWVRITASCEGTFDAPALPSGEEQCRIADTTGIKIMTLSFSSFAVLESESSGGSSGGGGSSGTRVRASVDTTVNEPTGRVLGASTVAVAHVFTSEMGNGASGDEVTALQAFLIAHGYLQIAAPTGYFGPMTEAALKLYQGSKGISATGYFGPLTLAAVNAESQTSVDAQIATLKAQLDVLVKELQVLLDAQK